MNGGGGAYNRTITMVHNSILYMFWKLIQSVGYGNEQGGGDYPAYPKVYGCNATSF